jgi:hypothetical protein
MLTDLPWPDEHRPCPHRGHVHDCRALLLSDHDRVLWKVLSRDHHHGRDHELR